MVEEDLRLIVAGVDDGTDQDRQADLGSAAADSDVSVLCERPN